MKKLLILLLFTTGCIHKVKQPVDSLLVCPQPNASYICNNGQLTFYCPQRELPERQCSLRPTKDSCFAGHDCPEWFPSPTVKPEHLWQGEFGWFTR